MKIRLFLFAMTIWTSSMAAQAAPNISSVTKNCQWENYEACFQSQPDDFRFPSKPFTLFHSTPSEKAAVLVHGLTDSPYIMKDIASLLFQQGYDVYAILLAGHGTTAEDLFSVSEKTWQSQLKQAIALMKTRSSQILLGGFSTGGALILREALRSQNELQGLLLFSPAIEIDNLLAGATCVQRFFTDWAADEDAKEDSPWRYNRMPSNAVCQLLRLTQEIGFQAPRIKLPVFAAISKGDQTVNVAALMAYVAQLQNPMNQKIILENRNIRHADVPLRQNSFEGRSNPSFPQIESELKNFLLKL